MLFIPKLSLQPGRTSQKVCIVGRVRLGLFNMGVCVVEPALVGKQDRQEEMSPEQLLVEVERGRNPEV